MRNLAILVIGSVLLPFDSLSAQEDPDTESGARERVTGIGIGLSIGYYDPDVDAAGGDGAAELFVRYTAHNGLSVSGGVELGIPSNDNASAATLTVFVDPRLVVGGIAAAPSVRPVIGARLGWSSLEREGGASHTSFVIGFAAGVQVRILNPLGLELGVRSTNFTSDLSRIGAYGGIEVTL